MIRLSFAILTGALLLTPPALAQGTQPSADRQAMLDMQARLNAAPNPNLQPVETLTCDQMLVEMTAAGQRMNSQLDPSFATNAKSLHDQAMGKEAPPPGGASAEAAANNRGRVDQLGGQLATSMQGIDVQRMMAIGNRFSAQKCPTPAGPSPQ